MSESLKSIVAELLAIDPEQLGSDRALAGARLQGSIGRSILDAALRRRLNIQSPACYTAKTFGELESAIDGKPLPTATNGSAVSTPVISIPKTDSTSCGIDIELIESLPTTSDFWTHEFYTTHFTPAEIAYCLTQQNPAPHFAARWCAKEALKKCEPGLIGEDWLNLEVVSHPGIAPTLRHRNTDLPHALSLSHTNHSAVAIVMKVSPSKPAPVAPAIIAPPRSSGKLGLIALAISLVALAVAIVGIVMMVIVGAPHH
jgi:phosphopantetheine--protein transferase-like protein